MLLLTFILYPKTFLKKGGYVNAINTTSGQITI